MCIHKSLTFPSGYTVYTCVSRRLHQCFQRPLLLTSVLMRQSHVYNLYSVVIFFILFMLKQQHYTLKFQCKWRYHILKLWQFNTYKNVSYLLPRSDNSGTRINPAPGTCNEGGGAIPCYFREEEEKIRDARKHLFI